MPITVDIDVNAEKQIDALDATVQSEVRLKLDKIRADYPHVSGLKPMRTGLKNHVTERVGHYRIILKKEEGKLIVVKVEHRSEVYKTKASRRDVNGGKSTGWVLLPNAFATEAMRGRPTRNFAGEYVMWSLGQNLLAARREAGLTQKALARKIRRAQSTVSMAEKGQIRVSTAFVRAVLRACQVPEDWGQKYWKS